MNHWIFRAATGGAFLSAAWSFLAAARPEFQHRVQQARKTYTTLSEPSLDTHVPYTSQVTASIIKTATGDYLCVWKLDGLDIETADEGHSMSAHEAFNQYIRSATEHKLAFWSHKLRRRITAVQGGVFPNKFSESLHELHADTIEQSAMYATEFYLTLIYRPAPGAASGHTIEDKRGEERDAIECLETQMRHLEQALAPYGLTRLSCYREGDATVSEVLTFLGYLVNGYQEPVPTQRRSIAQTLPTARLRFGPEAFHIRGPSFERYGAFLDIKDFPESTVPGMLNTLLCGDYEYIETQSFSPLNKARATQYLERQRNRLISSADVGVSQIEALGVALDQLADGRFVLGEYHYSLAVFGEDLVDATENIAHARSRLQERGFHTALIDLIPDAAWFAQWPANWAYRPRAAHLSSRNYCSLVSMQNYFSGKESGNPWGDAVTVFQTPSRSPFYFNFHQSARNVDAMGKKLPGNTMIVGQTGSGKTVLELFLLSEATRFDPRIVVFDKDRGTEIALRAMGASYFVFEQGRPTGLVPLQWPVSEATILFWEAWIAKLVDPRGQGLSASESNEISHAVRTIATFGPEHRTLGTLCQNLSDHSPNSVSARLERWCAGAPLGWVFDSPENPIDLEGVRITGFDTTDFLDDAEVRTPVMMCLLHWIEQHIDGDPFIYVMAEFWKSLSDPVFADFVKNKQKTIRKQNGLGIFDTQSPSDVLANPIARTLIEQTTTFIFTANPRADRSDYVDGFKLSDREFEMVRQLTASGREFLVKQGSSCTRVTLDLSSAPDFLDVLSTTTDNVAILDQIRERMGDHPDDWMEEFLSVVRERRTRSSRVNRKHRNEARARNSEIGHGDTGPVSP